MRGLQICPSLQPVPGVARDERAEGTRGSADVRADTETGAVRMPGVAGRGREGKMKDVKTIMPRAMFQAGEFISDKDKDWKRK